MPPSACPPHRRRASPRLFLVLGLLGALTACGTGAPPQGPAPATGTARQSIISGEPAPDADAVVALALASNRFVFCTATVIAPRVVATAGHCVRDLRADQILLMLGSDPASGTYLPVADVRLHPRHALAPEDTDVALVLVRDPLPVTPIPPLQGVGSSVLVHAQLHLLGFGVTEIHLRTASPRRQGAAEVIGLSETQLTAQAAPAMTCFGDSGGPALVSYEGVEHLAGVALRSDCNQKGTFSRVDIHYDGFLRPVLETMEPGRAPVGARCVFDDQCLPGARCEAAPDEPLLHYCTASCTSDAECPTGLYCVGLPDAGIRQCAWPRTPGSLGTSCAFDAQCVRGTCNGAGYLACTEATRDNGCAAGGGGASTGLAWILLIALLISRRRRLRR